MSTTAIQQSTPPPEIAQPEENHPTGSVAMVQKRKRATTATTRKDADTVPAPPRKTQKKATVLSLTDPTKQYGIFQHNDLLDTTGTDAELVHTVSDFTSAHTHLLAHASTLISSNAAWGATSTRSSHSKFEILNYDHAIRARFDIDTVCSTADGDWVREREWLATHYADRPREHYSMIVEVDCADAARRTDYVLGNFVSLGEASTAMKTSALGYLAANTGARLLERSIELVNADGGVVRRFLIAKGRMVEGKFVSEEQWVKKEIALRDGDEDALAALRSDEAKEKGILRLPTPPASAEGEVEKQHEQAEKTVREEVQQDETEKDVQQVETAKDVQQQQQPVQPQLQEAEAEAEAEVEADTAIEKWCTCRQPDRGEFMIACDNDDCPVQWYHGICLGLDKAPEGDWLCPACAPGEGPATAASTKDRGAKGKGNATGKGGKTKANAKVTTAKGKSGKSKKKKT